MKWYNSIGENSDVVICTGVRFVRNINEYSFPIKLSNAERIIINRKVNEIVNDAFPNLFNYIELDSLTPVQKASMAERMIISPEFAGKNGDYGLLLSNSENCSIMLNEENHISVFAIKPGVGFEEAFKECSKVINALSANLNFAYDKKIGYLTQSPSDLGTAMKATAMLHLPILTELGQISRFANTISSLGLTIKPIYGLKNRSIGNFYQISNRITLGITEETAISNLNAIVNQIINKEKSAASQIINELSMQDRIFRALGILQNARILSYDEFISLISFVRLGVANGIINIPIEVINSVIIGCAPATISVLGGISSTQIARDTARAEIVRNTLSMK